MGLIDSINTHTGVAKCPCLKTNREHLNFTQVCRLSRRRWKTRVSRTASSTLRINSVDHRSPRARSRVARQSCSARAHSSRRASTFAQDVKSPVMKSRSRRLTRSRTQAQERSISSTSSWRSAFRFCYTHVAHAHTQSALMNNILDAITKLIRPRTRTR